MNAQTLKGFRDFLPQEARKRQYVIDTMRSVFSSYGFEPLETPALEYEEVLLGKYGEEGDKLMYRFEDNGQRRVALRYDQTVPLARVVAQYQNDLPMPFKRYQIQNVWRAENTQKGRFREFLQCDIDTVGISSVLADAEIIEVTITTYKKLGFKNFKVLLNDRAIFGDLPTGAIIAIDKLKKIGRDGVINELLAKGFSKETVASILSSIEGKKPTQRLEEIFAMLEKLGVEKSQIAFSPTLARGLDYYTGVIIEIECPDYPTGSLAGGGRYDNLIGMFSGNAVPAVGLAFGFDRIIEAMDELNLFPKDLQTTKILVTIFSPDLLDASIKTCEIISLANISQELYVDPNAKMDRQLRYADAKSIPYVAIIGPEEAAANTVTLKNMKERTQKTIPQDQLAHEITS